jgi:hypothetical protein
MTIPRTTPVSARDHCLAPSRTVDSPLGGGRYGRMFPQLPQLKCDDALLFALGRAGGGCDGSARQRGEARSVAAGWPVFGQYVAHDITADRSPVTHHDDEELLRNVRSARLDLECLYGDGPTGAPYLYGRRDPASLLEGAGLPDGGADLPRNHEGTALVADPRQDVHVLISQMHLGMIRAHNRLVVRLRADGVPDSEVFAAARRALTWHYQWVVAHDFLPATIGTERVARLLSRPRSGAAGVAVSTIPLEFADAAYRYGHSQMRECYRIRPGGPQLRLFPELIGFGPVAADRAVDWSVLLDTGPTGEPAQRAGRIDGTLPAALIHLPVEVTGDLAAADADQASLAVRDLLRGTATALPSGEAVAGQLGLAPLTSAELGLRAQGWEGETPLWFYLLKESEAREDGERLGPVGAHIVGETLIGVLDADPGSYRAVDPGWTPTLPGRVPGRFSLADLLLPV